MNIHSPPGPLVLLADQRGDWKVNTDGSECGVTKKEAPRLWRVAAGHLSVCIVWILHIPPYRECNLAADEKHGHFHLHAENAY